MNPAMNFEFRIQPLGVIAPPMPFAVVASVTIHRAPAERETALHKWLFLAGHPRAYTSETIRALRIVNQMFMSTTRGLNP